MVTVTEKEKIAQQTEQKPKAIDPYEEMLNFSTRLTRSKILAGGKFDPKPQISDKARLNSDMRSRHLRAKMLGKDQSLGLTGELNGQRKLLDPESE